MVYIYIYIYIYPACNSYHGSFPESVICGQPHAPKNVHIKNLTIIRKTARKQQVDKILNICSPPTFNKHQHFFALHEETGHCGD